MATLAQFATLEEAKAFEQYRSKFFNNNTMNSVLSQLKLLAPLTAISQDLAHPFVNEALAVLKSDEYNFRRDSDIGLLQLAMLDTMIASNVTIGAEDLTPKLTALKGAVDRIANEVYKPFEATTLHEFQVAKGTVAKKSLPVSANGDAVFINVTTACERHSPNITLANGTRIGAFYQVANTGFYFAQIPNEYRGQSYFVDDAYGAIA